MPIGNGFLDAHDPVVRLLGLDELGSRRSRVRVGTKHSPVRAAVPARMA